MEFQEHIIPYVIDKENPYKRITRRIDSTKIRHNYKKELDVKVSNIGDLDVIKNGPVRSGVIIYTQIDGEIYFCLGVDTESGNLTDFGGGVKKNETIVDGGLRELEEESQGVFGRIEKKTIEKMIAFHTHNMTIMFVFLDVDRDHIVKLFTDRIQKATDPEVSNILWLSNKELMESIHGRGKKLYIRVRKLLSKVTSVISSMK